MKQEVKIGQTDYTVLILVRDTAGVPKTALTYASAGIDICYTRVETDNDVVLTDGAPVETTLTGAHVDWGFVKVDDTKAPGLYKLDIADGVFATGAWSAIVSLICTGCDPVHIEFILVPEAPGTGVVLAPTHPAVTFASITVSGGMVVSNSGGSALTLTAGGNGHGLLSTGSGTGSGITGAGSGTGNGAYFAGDDSGQGILAVGGDAAVALTAGIYAKSQASTNPVGLYVEDGAVITDDAGTALLVSSTGGNGDGVTIVGHGSGGDLVADITGGLSGAVGSVTGAVGSVTGSVGSVTGAVGSVTGAVGSVTGSVGSVATAGANALADAFLARNVSGGSSTGRTVKQALHMLRNKAVVSGGTMTIYDTDDTTESWTAAVTGTAGANPITTVDPA